MIAAPADLFVDPASDNYQLKPGSPALDRGTATQAPTRDLAGNSRPAGAGFDIGAYERAATTIGTPGDDTIYLRASTDGTLLDVYNADPAMNAPVVRWPMTSTQPLILETLAGNDELIVELPIGSAGPLGGVRYLAGDGANKLSVSGGSIAIESSATGTLQTSIQNNARLTTGSLVQDTLTLSDSGRVTLRPGGGTSILNTLDFGGTAVTAVISDQALIELPTSIASVATSQPIAVRPKGVARFVPLAAKHTYDFVSLAEFRAAVDQAMTGFNRPHLLRSPKLHRAFSR
jgi:hypothetical protein